MKTLAEILDRYEPCTCGEMYISRNLVAPDCPRHGIGDPEAAAEEYAEQMAIGFAEWILKNDMIGFNPGRDRKFHLYEGKIEVPELFKFYLKSIHSDQKQ